VELLGGVVGEGDGEVHGNGFAAPGLHHNVVAGAGFGDAGDGQVRIAAVEKPTLPEPVEVAAGAGIHAVEEVVGHGVLAVPLADVGVQGLGKQLVAEQVLHVEVAHAGLGVGVEEEGQSVLLGAERDDGRVVLGVRVLGVAGHAVVVVQLGINEAGNQPFADGGPAFVHPAVLRFVDAQVEGKHRVEDFVVGEGNGVLTGGGGVVVHHHRVLHLVEAVEHGFVRVGKGPLRKGVAHGFHRFAAEVDDFFKVLVFGVVHGVDAGAALGGGVHHEAGGLPHVVVAGGKNEVRDVAGLEAPGVGGVGRGNVAPLGIRRVDDVGNGVLALGFLQALGVLGGQHLGGVFQVARGPYHKVFGHGDGGGEIAEVVVKLLVAGVGRAVPAVNIVVHGNAREEIGHKRRARLHLAGAVVRVFVQDVGIRNLHRGGLARPNGPAQGHGQVGGFRG